MCPHFITKGAHPSTTTCTALKGDWNVLKQSFKNNTCQSDLEVHIRACDLLVVYAQYFRQRTDKDSPRNYCTVCNWWISLQIQCYCCQLPWGLAREAPDAWETQWPVTAPFAVGKTCHYQRLYFLWLELLPVQDRVYLLHLPHWPGLVRIALAMP